MQNERGKCKHRLTCPFHGWSYALNGALKTVPYANTFKDLEKSKLSLVKAEHEIWHGFIFARFGGDAPAIADTLAPVEKMLTSYRAAAMQPLRKPFYETRPYNWKVIHDIDNEGYHVPIGHPGLQSLYGNDYKDLLMDDVPVSIGNIQAADRYDTWSVARYKKVLPRFPHLTEKEQSRWVYIGIFPNAVFAFYPDMMEFYMTLPESPTQTRYCSAAYGLPDNRRATRLTRYLNERINMRTEAEDESFVSWLQEGLNSSAFPEIKLSAIESGCARFPQTHSRHLTDGQPETCATGGRNRRN